MYKQRLFDDTCEFFYKAVMNLSAKSIISHPLSFLHLFSVHFEPLSLGQWNQNGQKKSARKYWKMKNNLLYG